MKELTKDERSTLTTAIQAGIIGAAALFGLLGWSRDQKKLRKERLSLKQKQEKSLAKTRYRLKKAELKELYHTTAGARRLIGRGKMAYRRFFAGE